MEKTAIQEAIKEIVESWSSPGDRPNYTQILNILESKLEMEKQQIIDAYKYESDNSLGAKILAEQYYNKTFKSE